MHDSYSIKKCFRSLHTDIVICIPYSVLNVRKANTQFDVRQKMNWSTEENTALFIETLFLRRGQCLSYFRDRTCLNLHLNQFCVIKLIHTTTSSHDMLSILPNNWWHIHKGLTQCFYSRWLGLPFHFLPSRDYRPGNVNHFSFVWSEI
jgi:hypothetical protein